MDLVIGAQAGDEECYIELWDKFFPLRQREKYAFIEWCKEHHISYSTYHDYVESWDADAWEKFRNQMPGIRIQQLKDLGYTPQTWGIYIRLRAYLEVVNRMYSATIMKKLTHEVSATVTKAYKGGQEEGAETSLFDTMEYTREPGGMETVAKGVLKEAYAKALQELTPAQQKIVLMRAEKVKYKKIIEELGIDRKEATKVMTQTKKRIKYWIAESSKQKGIPMTYDDVVELLH